MSEKGTGIKVDRPAYGSPYDEIAMASLWGEGYFDTKIGRIMGASHSAIHRWRMRRGIPCNYKGHSYRISKEEEIARISLWGGRYTDTEIARTLGCTMPTILYWRRKRGLPPNYEYRKGPLSEEEEILRASLWGELLHDKEIAEKLGLSRGDIICKWRHCRGIPTNPATFRTRLKLKAEEEIVRASLWGEGYSNRDMARTLGLTPQAITYWRRRRGIPKAERQE